jgi:hypothetical protein
MFFYTQEDRYLEKLFVSFLSITSKCERNIFWRNLFCNSAEMELQSNKLKDEDFDVRKKFHENSLNVYEDIKRNILNMWYSKSALYYQEYNTSRCTP